MPTQYLKDKTMYPSPEEGRQLLPSPDCDNGHATMQEERPMTKKVNIRSLLNPEQSTLYDVPSINPPLTPDSGIDSSSPTLTDSPNTPISPAKPKRLSKDGAVFVRALPKSGVNYMPFERTSETLCLTAVERDELTKQHEVFKIFPSGKDGKGFIKDYTRHIPYSSDKKGFYGKTGREAFEVFQYTFVVPGDTRVHTVMWDYQVGLVRITPFFKACNLSKTTPAKALTTNLGLKEISHSITGGALVAQGYWIPYACARAICLTFCYPIRFALTPIFGPSFIKECLYPDNKDFGRFNIDIELVRAAEREAQAWRANIGCHDSPASKTSSQLDPPTSIPRSAPDDVEQVCSLERPVFKLDSPFSPATHNKADPDSPAVSPKSTSRRGLSPSGWTSINTRLPYASDSPSSSPPSASAAFPEPTTSPSSSSTGPSGSAPDGAWTNIQPIPGARNTTPWRAADSPRSTPLLKLGKAAGVQYPVDRSRKRRARDWDDAPQAPIDSNTVLVADAERRRPAHTHKKAKQTKEVYKPSRRLGRMPTSAPERDVSGLHERYIPCKGTYDGMSELHAGRTYEAKSDDVTSTDLWAARSLLQLVRGEGTLTG